MIKNLCERSHLKFDPSRVIGCFNVILHPQVAPAAINVSPLRGVDIPHHVKSAKSA